jgi:hypothetical protein
MRPSSTSDYYLVHANVAHARAPLDWPVMAGFVAQVEEINELARRAPGFVAQPQLPDEGVVYAAPFLLNVSVWESVAALDAFTHQGQHGRALEQRGQWFKQQGTSPKYVLYWTGKGQSVTEKQVKERLDYLGKHGPTPYAFTFERPFTVSQACEYDAAEDKR